AGQRSPAARILGWRSRAWRTSASADDQAARATTSNRSGSARTTSIVWVPIDPVDPAMATVVTATARGYPGVARAPRRADRPLVGARGSHVDVSPRQIRRWRGRR